MKLYDKPGTCPECGEPLATMAEIRARLDIVPHPATDLDLLAKTDLLYECLACSRRRLEESRQAVADGRTYKAREVFAQLRGGPKALMDCEKHPEKYRKGAAP